MYLGKALMDGQITPVHLVQPLYKHIMGWPVTLKDLEHIDDQVYRNLMELLDFEDLGSLFLGDCLMLAIMTYSLVI